MTNQTTRTTNTKKGDKMSIKTTARNQIWVLQKRVGKAWHRVEGTFFDRRRFAREASNELNNMENITGRGPNRVYRVATMRVVSDSKQ